MTSKVSRIRVQSRGQLLGTGSDGVAPVPLTGDDLLSGEKIREFIIIAGKDGVGKTSSVLSIARVVAGIVDDPSRYEQWVNPDAQFFIIDTENKVRSMYKRFGVHAPPNVVYYYCQDMNAVLLALEDIWSRKRPGDWVAVDSMARIWEMAQDLGYEAVSGLSKLEFLERRREQATKGARASSHIPQPDQFWNIVKSAHDRHFLNELVSDSSLNVVMTTILTRPPREVANRQENKDRKDFRHEFGIEMGLGGAPTLPYQPETLILLDREKSKVRATTLRDNLSVLDEPSVALWIEGFKTFGIDLYETCRILPEGSE